MKETFRGIASTDAPRLVLLTSQFPFGKGEEFLETEILYLVRHFAVDIVPTSVQPDKFSRQREVSSTVRVRSDLSKMIINATSHKITRLLRHPRMLVAILKLLWKERKQLPLNFKSVKRFLMVAVRAFMIKSTLEQAYASENVACYYSYWLNFSALALAIWKSQGLAALVISRTHRGDLYVERRPDSYQPAQEQTIQGLDRIICISEHGLNYLRRRYPVLSDKFLVFRLGVPAATSRSRPSQDERLHIVTCSYLTAVKRVELFIEALRHCSRPITWIHLGGGPLEATLRKQARQLPPWITWKFTGIIPNREVLNFYRSEPADLFVNVSSSEGLPVSIMEALSYGIPVAATDVGGTAELVNRTNGFLWPAEVTPQQIATTLKNFYELSADKKLVLREAALQTWANKVNAEKQYQAFSQWLEDLLVHKTEGT